MLREYEMTVISRSDIPETESQKLLGRFESLMVADGGEILKKDSLGSRRLAYPINKHFRGVYTHYDFVGMPVHLTEMERLMRIDENVLRYMSVKLGPVEDIELRKAELNKPKVNPVDDSRDF